jgi:uncharacterized protein with beta-barrel porin domain
MTGMQGIVDMRQTFNAGGTNGINSGDELLKEKHAWIKPYTSFGSQDNKDGINGFGVRANGFGLGVDGEYAKNEKIGLAFFYTKAYVDVNNVAQTSELDVLSTLVYGNMPLFNDEVSFLYQLGYAWQNTSTTRNIAGGPTANADYTSSTAALDLKLMKTIDVSNKLILQPMVQASYRHYTNPSYSETDAGALNLQTDGFSADEMIAGVGGIAHYRVDKDSGFIANANVGYDFRNDISTVTTAYQGAPTTTFNTAGIDNGRWGYDAGVGYEIGNVLGGEINFMYNYQAKGTAFRNNTLSTKYVLKF